VSEPGCLVVVSGLPGSGKTTQAKRLQAERSGVLFCPDEWMTALGANLWDGELRARVEGLQWDMAIDVLRAGGTAIIEWGPWAETNASV
jgi:predicted kinase